MFSLKILKNRVDIGNKITMSQPHSPSNNYDIFNAFPSSLFAVHFSFFPLFPSYVTSYPYVVV